MMLCDNTCVNTEFIPKNDKKSFMVSGGICLAVLIRRLDKENSSRNEFSEIFFIISPGFCCVNSRIKQL